MAYDPNLWAPADLPGYLSMPSQGLGPADHLGQVINRSQAQNSRVVKLLNRFRVVMDAEAPAATGSGFLWLDTATAKLYYDEPRPDPVAVPPAWVEVSPGGAEADAFEAHMAEYAGHPGVVFHDSEPKDETLKNNEGAFWYVTV